MLWNNKQAEELSLDLGQRSGDPNRPRDKRVSIVQPISPKPVYMFTYFRLSVIAFVMVLSLPVLAQSCPQSPVASFTGADGDTIRACIGDQATFNGSSSTAPPGRTIVQWIWNDGADQYITNNATFVLDLTIGGYHAVSLMVVDDTGCESASSANHPVLVARTPHFQGSIVPAACVGMPIDMGVDLVARPMLGAGGASLDALEPVHLPDQLGTPVVSSLFWTTANANDVIEDASELGEICLDLEHSSMGDIIITLTCPNGISVDLHRQGGGVQYLGDPVDPQMAEPDTLGTCFTYCFNATPDFGTWVECSPSGITPNTVTLSSGALSLAPGSYTSIDPLSDLVGCPVNGEWTLSFLDLWAADNGNLCNWSIGPAQDATFAAFGPQLGTADPDSSYWTGPDIVNAPGDPSSASTTVAVQSELQYTYTVFDSFGCQHDTTFTARVFGPILADAGPDQVICSSVVPLNGAINLPTGPVDCLYTLVLTDSGANGWGNSRVSVNIDGQITNYTLTLPNAIRTISIPLHGASSIRLSYTLYPNSAQNSIFLMDTQDDTLFSVLNGPPNGLLYTGAIGCSVPGLSAGWSPATGLTDTVGFRANAFPVVDTEYVFSYIVAGPSGCSGADTAFVIASMHEPLVLTYDTVSYQMCVTPGYSSYNWEHIGLGGGAITTEPCRTISTPWIYHGPWTVIATDDDGCIAYSDMVIVCPTPIFIILNGRIYANNGFSNYVWTYNGQLMVGQNTNSVLPVGPGLYEVTFTAYDCTVQGSYPYLITLGLEESRSTSPSMSIRPVPNNGDFTIECRGVNAGEAHLRITDMTGRTVHTRQLGRMPSELLLNVHLNVSPGAYFVELLGAGTRVVQRVVVQ